ncbi:hypothetical protein FRC17_005785, partial [Serendipita sp. 399]
AEASRDAQQREARKRNILAALEDDPSSEEDSKEKKKKRRASLSRDQTQAMSGPEIASSSQTMVLSQGVKVRGALSEYNDELSCPILAPQVLNPCGHSVCGDCIIHWIDHNRDRPTCPTCRATVNRSTPYLHNFAIDNTVEKHIEVLRKNKDGEWKEDGIKWKERQVRKRLPGRIPKYQGNILTVGVQTMRLKRRRPSVDSRMTRPMVSHPGSNKAGTIETVFVLPEETDGGAIVEGGGMAEEPHAIKPSKLQKL